MKLSDNLIIRSIRRSLRLLPPSFKKRGLLMLGGIFVNSIVDLIGLAALLPLFAAVLQEGFIEKNEILSFLYNSLGFQEEKWFIAFLCALSLSFILLKNLFGLWRTREQMNFIFDAYQHTSIEMFKAVYLKGYTYFNAHASHKIQNRIVNLPQNFSQSFLTSLLQFLSESMIILMILVSLIVYDPRIVLILIGITLPVFTLFYQASKKKINTYQQRIHDLNPKKNKSVYEMVFGYTDVVISNAFSFFQKQYAEDTKESKQLKKQLSLLQQIPARLVEISVFFTLTLILLYGAFWLKDTGQILTMLTVLGLATYRAIPSVNKLFLAFISIKQQEFAVTHLEHFLPLQEHDKSLSPIHFQKSITYKNIGFKYEDSEKPVLTDFNLEIRKGETVGIVGKSGSGKTTLLNLLLGFLTPAQGEILIDNVPLNRENLADWYRQIGYVRQDIFLVDGDVTENVAFGIPRHEINLERLHHAIARAQLADVIESLPQKMETNIGERGSKLSGGQRQRIAIARALYHGAAVLLFDEATSALDTETEKEITDAIHSLKDQELTILIISHRESALKYCDRIIEI